MDIIKLQAIVCGVIAGLPAVQQNHIAGYGKKRLLPVSHRQRTLLDINQQAVGIVLSLKTIFFCTIEVAAPGDIIE